MKHTLLFAASLIAVLLVAFTCHTHTAQAQEAHQHQHEHSEKLGRVSFPVSCTNKPRGNSTARSPGSILSSMKMLKGSSPKLPSPIHDAVWVTGASR